MANKRWHKLAADGWLNGPHLTSVTSTSRAYRQKGDRRTGNNRTMARPCKNCKILAERTVKTHVWDDYNSNLLLLLHHHHRCSCRYCSYCSSSSQGTAHCTNLRPVTSRAGPRPSALICIKASIWKKWQTGRQNALMWPRLCPSKRFQGVGCPANFWRSIWNWTHAATARWRPRCTAQTATSIGCGWLDRSRQILIITGRLHALL